MAKKHSLVVMFGIEGQVVDDLRVPFGENIQIGGSAPGAVAVPVPAGMEFVARVLWYGPARAVVLDGLGRQHVLEPDNELLLELGDVSLRLVLAESFTLRRNEFLTARGSLAWFVVVVGATILTMQGGWWQNPSNHCPWATGVLPRLTDVAEPILWLVGLTVAAGALLSLVVRQAWRDAPSWLVVLVAVLAPTVWSVAGLQWRSGEEVLERSFAYCFPEDQGGGQYAALSAEYLARLLREDYEGDEHGALEMEERPDAAKKAERVYLPAGNKGPVTDMGGAADTAPTPVRAPDAEEEPLPEKKEATEPPLYVEGPSEVKVPEPAEAPTEAKDGVVEIEAPEEEAPPEDLPAEEKEGWGIQDWYDEQDAAMENVEIEVMIFAARRRLRIDPNDPAALALLSYYQYLAQDYDAAIATYDRYIENNKDDAAGYNNKALVYKRRGEYEKEEALYRVALGLEPGDVTALNNLGVNLAHQGRFDEALEVMRQLEVLDPGDPYADLHRAKIYAEMRDDERAYEYLEKALEGMKALDTLHHIEFRQDIRVDPSFARLRQSHRFRGILVRYYGKDSPLQE